MTAMVAILNPSAAKVAIRFGSRVPIIGGQVLMMLGLLGLAVASVDLPVWGIALLMVRVGVGGSFTVPHRCCSTPFLPRALAWQAGC